MVFARFFNFRAKFIGIFLGFPYFFRSGCFIFHSRSFLSGSLYSPGVDHKYMLLGGVLGAFITFTVIKSVDVLGPARANMFIITAQLLVAYLIELFGLFGTEKADFDFKKLIGIGLMIGGIVIFKWK